MTVNKGAYCLVMRLDKDTDIAVGRRPLRRFPQGWFCYAGSALNNLDRRIARHRSMEKKRRWHIDFLLDHAMIVHVERILTRERIECDLSRALEAEARPAVMPGFGSSDCACRTHLHFFYKNPTRVVHGIARRLGTGAG